MGPEDLLLVVMITALNLYAVLGGADFGAGIWEFTTALQSSRKEREHIFKAIGPVWEANHVWLIFVLTILLNGFPKAYATLSRGLWLPLLLALGGIVFRGASYVFRSYGQGAIREQTVWEGVFAIASMSTPLFLGACAGAIASGQLRVRPDAEFGDSHLAGWISSMTVFTAFYSVGMCAYLAAVFLAREAWLRRDDALIALWRQRTLSTGLWMGMLSWGGLVMVWVEAPLLAAGFANRGWPLVLVSLGCGLGSLYAAWRSRFTLAGGLAAGAVSAVIWGWGISQYPFLIPPTISSTSAKSPDQVLWMMLGVIAAGAVLLFPSLAYLFLLFKGSSRPAR